MAYRPDQSSSGRRNARHEDRRGAFIQSQFGGAFMQHERIVGVGLLTSPDLALLGAAFDRLWPVEEAPCFSRLLRAIDTADEHLANQHNAPDRCAVRG